MPKKVVIRVNYRNTPGGSGYPHQHQYPPHSPHGGHHRQGNSQQNQGLGGASAFGIGNGGFLPPAAQPAPVQIEETLPVVVPETAAELVETAAPAKTGFSLPNLTEIKGFVDRMGGIDGIITTMTKVQKVVSSVSQMAPLVKVLMGSFKKGGDTEEAGEFVPKKRKRRKKKTGSTPAARRRKRKRPR